MFNSKSVFSFAVLFAVFIFVSCSEQEQNVLPSKKASGEVLETFSSASSFVTANAAGPMMRWEPEKKRRYCTEIRDKCFRPVVIVFDVSAYNQFKTAVDQNQVATYFSGSAWSASGLFDDLESTVITGLANGAYNIVRLPDNEETVAGKDFYFIVDGTVSVWSEAMSTTGGYHLVLDYNEA